MDRIQVFRDWLDKRPDDRFARYSLALELKNQGDAASAEAEFRRLLATHPDSGAGAMQLADLLDQDGRIEEAIAVLRAAAEALGQLETPEARRELSEVLGELEQLEELA